MRKGGDFVNEPDKDKSEKDGASQQRCMRHKKTKVQLKVMNKFYIIEAIVF
jgi:hypothetical protein